MHIAHVYRSTSLLYDNEPTCCGPDAKRRQHCGERELAASEHLPFPGISKEKATA